MDAAAREIGIDPRRAAPAQHDPARADAVQEPDGRRPTTAATFEQIMDQGLALADWSGFEARRARVEGARQAARPRHRHLPRMDRRQRVRGARHRRRARPTASSRSSRPRRRWGRASRPATRSSRSTCSACRSSSVRIVQGDTDRGNGFGSAGSRSLFTGGSAVQVASRAHHRQGARRSPPRRSRPRPPTSSTAAAAFTRRRHRPSASTCSSSPRRQPEQRHPRRLDQRGRRADLAERLPRLRSRDRSGHRRGRGRGVRVGQRRRPRGQPDDRARPARRRRGAGHRPGAVRAGGLRPRAAASSLTGSFMDYAMPRADIVGEFMTEHRRDRRRA